MKPLYTLISAALLLCFTPVANAQIGHTTITFNDPDRSGGFGNGGGPGRQIQTEIYYPADVDGDDVELTEGTYPVVVFGHGFVMVWSAYENIWEALVPEGYIVCFPRTEGNFAPSHEDFGLDLALVATDMQALGAEETSLFFGHVSDRDAVMGHSMGGGASFIAAAGADLDAIIGLAAAETDPSAIAAAANVMEPLLMLAGGGDNVTPPSEHQIPIYDATSAMCKYLVTITGGGHCYFANSNFNCDTGELFSGSDINIERTEQQQTAMDYILPWLDHWLKDDPLALQTFTDLVWNDDRTTFVENCLVLSAGAQDETAIKPYPNPAKDWLFLEIPATQDTAPITVYDLSGRIVLQDQLQPGNGAIDVRGLKGGVYVLEVGLSSTKRSIHKVVVH